MDWYGGAGLIFINKRNVHKQSAFVPPPQVPLQWTSKYMSITFTETGLEFPWEGMNEKGVSAHLLLAATVLPTTDTVPAVNSMQWLQYILDTSATTTEAIANAQATQVTGPFDPGEHYIVCDATGSCATFDYISGALAIKTGTTLPYKVLTNNTYPQSRQNLETLLATSTPSQILALPATDSLTRFAKAAILSSEYSPQEEEIGYAFSGLNVVDEPDTQWRIAFSLANQSLQYSTRTAPALKYIDLQKFNPACASGVQYIHLNARTSGDITSTFLPFDWSANTGLVQSIAGQEAATISTLENYPNTTQCMETATTLTSSANPSNLGSPVILSAQVTGNGPALPTGTVTFRKGAATLGTGTVDSTGMAQLSTSTIPAGSHPLTAIYSGDSLNLASTSSTLWQGVSVSPTLTTLTTSPNPANVNQPVTFTTTVSSQGAGKPTGTVTVLDGSAVLGSATLNSQGSANLSLSLPAGQHSLTAVYSGDGVNASSISVTLSQMVNAQPTQIDVTPSLNPGNVAQPVSFGTLLAGQYDAVPTGTVTFRINGNAVPPIVRLQNGQASFVRAFLSSGSRSVSATYSGDANSLSSNSSFSQQVNAQPTQVALTSGQNTVTVGESINLTATVTGEYGGNPTGTVGFAINGSAPASVTMSGNQAAYSTSFSAPGAQTISATYSGDANDQTSSSSIAVQVVEGVPTQMSLVTSSNPVSPNQAVTYTATVTGQSGTTPVGTITFSHGGTVLATVALSNGQASFQKIYGSTGTRIITANYSGDGTNQPTSSSLTQIVQ
jgi:penicillin V acylase-like amidase (Ntn superfamily)